MRKFSLIITGFLTLAVSIIWHISGTETLASEGNSQYAPGQKSVRTGTADDLRGVYYSLPQEGLETAVGRLAVLLLTKKGDHRQVKLHHRFHTGESLRFIVSSNRDGWLYILHRSPHGEPQLLWPRINFGDKLSHLDINRMQAGREMIVPASPGKFTFDI